LLWSVPAGIIALKAAPGQPFLGTIAAWLLAAAVLGWRMAKGIQDTRMYGGRNPAAPGGLAEQPPAAPAGNVAQSGRPARVPRPPPPRARRPRAGPPPGARPAPRVPRGAPPRPPPPISVEDAMAELDAMIGLTPVKEQVRSIAASIEAARRRTVAGISTE